MLKRIVSATLLAFFSITALHGREWQLGNGQLNVVFDDVTSAFSVKDLATGKVWTQNIAGQGFQAKKVKLAGNELTAKVSGPFEFSLKAVLDGRSLSCQVDAKEKVLMEELHYPASFRTEDAGDYLLLTDSEGFLLKVDRKDYPKGEPWPFFCGGGFAMPWTGIVDSSLESGYMAIFDTPYDAEFRRTTQDNGLLCIEPVWVACKGKFSYSRKIIYHFFDKGGYVAQCKQYREYAKKNGTFRTLREKLVETPALERLLGAPHIYLWADGKTAAFVSRLKRDGIDRAAMFWDGNHRPVPEPEYTEAVDKQGYAVGVYDLFTDLKKRDTVDWKPDLKGPDRMAHDVYPGLFWELCLRTKDGGYTGNQFGTYACPSTMKEEIRKRMDRQNAEFPSQGVFVDVYQANGLYECYSDVHPVTREGYKDAIMENIRYIKQRYGMYLGSEWGADFANYESSFNQGMMTLQVPWWQGEINQAGTIYYYGNWRNNEKPSIQLEPYTASPAALNYTLNEVLRVPLYELVYHDCVVSTWRWEDGNNRSPEYWWKKDLFNVLYGTAPIWSLSGDVWNRYRVSFKESYDRVIPWLEEICLDEMVSHEFLTPDHTVQRTCFSSGKSVVVNFSDQVNRHGGREVAPRSYVIE